jgi:hypothetical protein
MIASVLRQNPILIILVVIILFGAFPSWGYNRGWGYFPFGGLLLLLLVLFLLGVL